MLHESNMWKQTTESRNSKGKYGLNTHEAQMVILKFIVNFSHWSCNIGMMFFILVHSDTIK